MGMKAFCYSLWIGGISILIGSCIKGDIEEWHRWAMLVSSAWIIGVCCKELKYK